MEHPPRELTVSPAGYLTSASSTVLALSWLFSATAQEFLASLVFVFVKHPFDAGDRVDIYNTGVGTTDTFTIREISLMYTEMTKLTGEVVQAPNSLLNTLFILNMRRSGSLAEPIPITVKFGTTIEQIDELRERMLQFVCAEKREYQPKILTELRDIPDTHAVRVNVVFFYKSNWQNELVRLCRRNKFMCTLMQNVAELGIESPNMRWPGQKQAAPVWIQNLSPHQNAADQLLSPPPQPQQQQQQQQQQQPADEGEDSGGGGGGGGGGGSDGTPNMRPPSPDRSLNRSTSVRSIDTAKKVDMSLGMQDMMMLGDPDVVDDDQFGRRLKAPLGTVLEEGEGAGSALSWTRSASTTSRRRRNTQSSHGSLHRRNWLPSRGRDDAADSDAEMALAGPTGYTQAGDAVWGGGGDDSGTMTQRADVNPPPPPPPPPLPPSVSEDVELQKL